jgi:shikimate kinase
MKIFLIGMPGSGKTTIGRKLSSILEMPFLDLDEQVVKFTGKSIKDIFAEHGEDYFRQVESNLLEAITVGNTRFVMATGGGAPCFFDNISFINKSGISIFLDVSVHEIVNRLLKTDITSRPLIGGGNQEIELVKQIENKLQNRLIFYQKAHIKIKSDHIDGSMVTKYLDMYLNRN